MAARTFGKENIWEGNPKVLLSPVGWWFTAWTDPRTHCCLSLLMSGLNQAPEVIMAASGAAPDFRAVACDAQCSEHHVYAQYEQCEVQGALAF